MNRGQPTSTGRRAALLLLLAGLCAPLSGLAQTNRPAQPVGSVSLDAQRAERLVSALETYDTQPALTGRVSIITQGVPLTLVNRWVSEYANDNAAVTLDVRGGTVDESLSNLLSGTVDLVPVTEPPPLSFVQAFESKYKSKPASILVGHDAIGIYVNKANPIQGLTLGQLDQLFSRTPQRGFQHPETWSDIGLSGPFASRLIRRYRLSEAHDTTRQFRRFIMHGADYRGDVSFQDVHGSLIQAVAADPAGVGFASVLFATPGTRLVPLQGKDERFYAPGFVETTSGDYPLSRRILILFRKSTAQQSNRAAREFLKFSLSRDGQRISALRGTYPISADEQRLGLAVLGRTP